MKADDLTWCVPAIWGTVAPWSGNKNILIRDESGTASYGRVTGHGSEYAGRRYLLCNSVKELSSESPSDDFIHLDFAQFGITPRYYLVHADEWVLRTFPQEPIWLERDKWVLLSPSDLPLAEVARPHTSSESVDQFRFKPAIDAAAFYAPYVPLTYSPIMVNPPPDTSMKFITRYDLTVCKPTKLISGI